MKTKPEDTATTLDGTAVKALTPASTATITTAAESMDALAIVAAEYVEAADALKQAEAKVAAIGKKELAAMKTTAAALHAEAETRKATEAQYAEDVFAKCYDAAKIHPALNGHINALREYATGAVKIDQPVKYIGNGLTETEYAPAVTDENREAVATFAPVRKATPNTAAILLQPGEAVVAIRELDTARTRYETAAQALADALHVYNECHAALNIEATAEAESVRKATAEQAKRDAE